MSVSTVAWTDPGFPSIAFIILNSALVFIMTPGLGFFFAGQAQAKHSLSLVMICMLAYAVVTLQWILFGYSLAFSETGSAILGDFYHAGLRNLSMEVLPLTAPQVPGLAFSLYQLQFATITAAIIFGSNAERFRILPGMIFIFIWTTVIYDPIAYWTWGARGWMKNMACLDTISLDQVPCLIGGLDYAGGGPVHIASGVAGAAYSYMLGKRTGYTTKQTYKPSHVTNIFLGTALLWFGWFGFNGGSAVAATPRAVLAAYNTVIAAAVCSFVLPVLECIFYTGKLSGIAWCTGAVTGLIAITPASGFVAPWAAIVIGVTAAPVVMFAMHIKKYIGIDDALNNLATHAAGGIWGCICTGLFTEKWVMALDGTTYLAGGAIEGNWYQLGYQIAGILAIVSYSWVGTLMILYVLNKVPGCKLRITEAQEEEGNDLAEMGEKAMDI